MAVYLPAVCAFEDAANPAAVLALLDTIAQLRQELRTVIDESNALVQRQRQELDAANQRAKAANEAFGEYGWHKPNCGYYASDPYECTCGYGTAFHAAINRRHLADAAQEATP